MKLYANCINVGGYIRSAIYDLQKQEYHLIPKDLSDYLDNKTKLNEADLIDYRGYLQEHDLIIDFPFFSKKNKFPKLDLTWAFPADLTNIILDFEEIKDLDTISNIIDWSRCQDIQIRILKSELDLEQLLNRICLNNLKSIELFLPHDDQVVDKVLLLAQKFSKLRIIGIYSSPKFQIIKDELFLKIFQFENDIVSKNQILASEFFNVNIQLFTEAQNHHTYFNRKLFINEKGELKNAPECDDIIASLTHMKKRTDFDKLIINSKLQKLWHTSKDVTNVCSSCEFRYMCVDNRIPIQRKDGLWFHKNECSYNPYIAKWSNDKGYKSLAECGVISNENEFSIDHEKIAEINSELWPD